MCIDVGCGSGQATQALVKHFGQVIGLDPSPAQLENAVQHEKIGYKTAQAHELQFAKDSSISAITAAQAAHWFDLKKFYTEASRVLEPQGVVGVWCYGLGDFSTPDDDKTLNQLVLEDYYEQKLGPHWDPRRRIVEHMYKDLDRPGQVLPELFHDEPVFDFSIIRKDVPPSELVGYLRSWSGYQLYQQAHPDAEDPLLPVESYLRDKPSVSIVWPGKLFLSKRL